MILVCVPVTTDWGKSVFREEKLTQGSQKRTECLWTELFLLDFPTSKRLAPEFSHTAPHTFSKWPPSFCNPHLFNPTEWHQHEVQWGRLKWRAKWQRNPWGRSCASSQIRISLKYQCNKWHTDLNFLYFLWCLMFLLKWLITFVVDLRGKKDKNPTATCQAPINQYLK